ncbi:hypothetical protein JCM19314_3122 [Nonlabens ulvanivorans]|uniref:Uncharacterized protein n=1 Tax=Nonlabens ulvanivorans TaxID=906888 RepID=A0A090QUF2_NONUL|nr:hypothetical protein JCM19314_3122 [Nonlabens ulvanivorans]
MIKLPVSIIILGFLPRCCALKNVSTSLAYGASMKNITLLAMMRSHCKVDVSFRKSTFGGVIGLLSY